MKRVNDAIAYLRDLGLPKAQQNERSALTLLALASVKPRGSWKRAKQNALRTVDIMEFMRTAYQKNYAANSRETIRRQTLHQFEQARIVDRNPDDPSRPTNSGNTCYALSDAAYAVIVQIGTPNYRSACEEFVNSVGSLRVAYQKRRVSSAVPLKLISGETVRLSPGKHNELQVAVIEEMGPRFAPGAEILYLGDTASKYVVCEQEKFAALGVPLDRHDKLPDIVLHDQEANWLFLIEAVTTHGPISEKRHAELQAMFARCPFGLVYVTAFLTRSDFRKYAGDIAWETEAWISDNPGHMIHFNGPKFLGPYPQPV